MAHNAARLANYLAELCRVLQLLAAEHGAVLTYQLAVDGADASEADAAGHEARETELAPIPVG